jgi:hypothetical protein
MDTRDLTAAERRVRRAFATGTEAAFGDPSGDAWGPDRTVRADVLRALLTGPPPDGAPVPALRVTGARVTGTLDLRDAVVTAPVVLRGCRFDAAPDLDSARTSRLRLTGSTLPGLHAPGLRVDGDLHLDGCRVTGGIRLDGARVEGTANLENAVLTNPGATAVTALAATIGRDLILMSVRADGAVRLRGARVGGDVLVRDSHLSDPGGVAFDAVNLAVGTDLQAIGLVAEGRVDLRGARVTGQLGLTYARLSNPGDIALRASSATAAELWLRKMAPIDGAVNLRRSQFEMVHAEPDLLPGPVGLDGLTYGTLLPRLPARDRLALLERDEEGFVPHAYEQLAAAYVRVGDDASARRVRLAKQRRQRATLPSHARLWGYLQDVTVGYGYRPLRAAGWIAVLLAVGTVAFGLHHPPPLEPGKAPSFNAFIYTLNLLVPIADFGQAHAFDPRGAYQWLSFLLTAAGWILATTVVAGVARVVNRP